MTFLLLNQTFWPDVMATGQYLNEVALALAEQGHHVTVVTSRRAYDDPATSFPSGEMWRGIRILRVGSTGLGKGAKWRRAIDFASFMISCGIKVTFLPRFDAVLALTSPPLISFLGAGVAKLRGSRFYYWVMDLNPDEAIAAGWLRANSIPARLLDWMSCFSLRHARKVIVLDRFMRDSLLAKGIPGDKVAVVPPWSQDGHVKFDPVGRERFRRVHGMEGKFVVMYSGNHSPCHPLDTLLEAVRRLASEREILFCFVGGGSEFGKVQALQATGRIVCLPYQAFDELSGSLSAADLHLVVMGDPFVGLVHPCKIYNILQVGAPVLYLGPRVGHVPEIFETGSGRVTVPFFAAEHGDVDALVQQILRARSLAGTLSRDGGPPDGGRFSRRTILPKLVSVLTSED